MKYKVCISQDEKVLNIFDEDNFNFIPENFFVLCEINGDENVEQVEKLIWILRPDLNL